MCNGFTFEIKSIKLYKVSEIINDGVDKTKLTRAERILRA